MADGISVDRNKSEFVLAVFSGVSGLRDHLRRLGDGVLAFEKRLENGGLTADDFAEVVGAGKPFPDGASALAWWEETKSLKFYTDQTVTPVSNWCAKSGI